MSICFIINSLNYLYRNLQPKYHQNIPIGDQETQRSLNHRNNSNLLRKDLPKVSAKGKQNDQLIISINVFSPEAKLLNRRK